MQSLLKGGICSQTISMNYAYAVKLLDRIKYVQGCSQAEVEEVAASSVFFAE